MDKYGIIAKRYRARKTSENIYRDANFHSTEETVALLENVGFRNFRFNQTLVVPDPPEIEMPVPGYGSGSFVVINAEKNVFKSNLHGL